MKLRTVEAGEAAVERRRACWVGVVIVAAGVAACGGGGGGASSGSPPPPTGTSPDGAGTVKVKVTDQFGDAVPRALVNVMVSSMGASLSKDTDESGVAQFDKVAAGKISVCTHHPVRGNDLYGCSDFTVQKDRVLEIARPLEVDQMPTIAVLETTVDPGGVGADGRSLDLTVRVAVTGGRRGWSWFADWNGGPFGVGCDARTGAELADLGPRCIAGVDGSDTSYHGVERNGAGVVGAIDGAPRSGAVGLLIDQSNAGRNEPRLFAAKVFADSLLPDVPLVLAAFASDMASGSASPLPQRPVTFFPVESPGFVVSRPAAFETLNALLGLTGGGAPLYEAIVAGIEFMASHAPPGSQPTLVVLADGTDSNCGTAVQCAQWRRTAVQRAQQAGVRLFLVGDDSDAHCGREPWDAEDRYYCETAIAAEAPLWELSSLGGIPLVVGSGPGYSDNLHSQLELVRQWLSGSMTVQDISFRLKSEVAGAFAPGAVVMGGLWGVNESFCPWDCMYFALPFRVQIPD